MTKFTLTDQQLAVLDFGTNRAENLLVAAAAGAAKTSTMVELSRRIPQSTTGLFLAFNKKIADELKEKLAPNFRAKTLNALGHAAWGQKLGKRLFLDKSKNFRLLKDLLEAEPNLEAPLNDSFSFITQSVAQLKGAGYVPDGYPRKNTRLIDDHKAWASLESEPTPEEWYAIRRVYTTGLDAAFEGRIDFNDQLLMPTVFHASFPIAKLVVIDEAQDLSHLNHQMLEKIVGKRGRLIAVGDQCQAIYGFRGASSDGMAEMKRRFNMTELPLSCSFRCPQAVVEHVQWRMPEMTHWEGNPNPGEIRRLSTWSLDSIPDKAAIICRNNAPLMSLALRFFLSGRYAKFWGNDIAAGLRKTLKALGPQNMSRDEALEMLEQEKIKTLRRARNQATVHDRFECMAHVLRGAETLGDAIEQLNLMLNAEGTIQLMTGHKAKGHEFNDVFFLNQDLVSEQGQDPNLRYVIATRAQRTLTYIDTETLVG